MFLQRLSGKFVQKLPENKYKYCCFKGKFDNKEELDQHIAAGGCWPSAMTINRLCDTAADNRTGAGPADIAQLLKIKQEKIDHDRAVQIKQEKLDMQQFGSVIPRQGSARAANPIIPNANLVLQNLGVCRKCEIHVSWLYFETFAKVKNKAYALM